MKSESAGNERLLNPALSAGAEAIRIGLAIAAFNSEASLLATIESVLRQGYDDWQLVVVDDGSTDHTLAVAQMAARRK